MRLFAYVIPIATTVPPSCRDMSRLLPLALVLSLGACNAGTPADAPEADVASGETSAASAFGGLVPTGNALTPDELIADAATYNGKTVVVEGDVREVCQMAGCWLALADDEGRAVRVEVPRDESESYVYTFPKDLAGATVRIAGTLAVEEESVADQRHYAEDGGATEAEVAAITEPKRTLVLTADGAEVLSRPASAPAPEAAPANA